MSIKEVEMMNYRKMIQDAGAESHQVIKNILDKIMSVEHISNKDLLWIAHDLKKNGYLNEAIYVLTKDRKNIEEKIPILHLRGGYYIDKKKYEEAISDFEDVIKLEKKIMKFYCSEEAAFFLAVCHKEISSNSAIDYAHLLSDDFETRFMSELWNKEKVINFIKK
ncbi:hypothetical protein LRS73_08330 [Methylobacterium currus]|uniref:hypothetical protein n=1 Tax=Methylobacterium currus TaxID=2051553 RepID=UPI001E4FA148|nr:hypothetical protein [Methylobacterium currus]UHC17849.1 hypothetical protein LRS73_08330 [Methylobacterium currus]